MDDVDAPVELILLVLGEAQAVSDPYWIQNLGSRSKVPDPCRIFVDSAKPRTISDFVTFIVLKCKLYYSW
jgi:hypothetical protein